MGREDEDPKLRLGFNAANLPSCTYVPQPFAVHRDTFIFYSMTDEFSELHRYLWNTLPTLTWSQRVGRLSRKTRKSSIFGSDMPAFGCTVTSRCRTTAVTVLCTSLSSLEFGSHGYCPFLALSLCSALPCAWPLGFGAG
jgi:hypothetical protein